MAVVACCLFTTTSLGVHEVLSITKEREQGTAILHLFYSKNWGP